MIATQHLINLGHKYIVYICSRAADSLNASIDARRQGFIHACQTAETSHDLHWKVLEVPRDGGYADSALARCWRLINSRMQSVVKPTPLRFR